MFKKNFVLIQICLISLFCNCSNDPVKKTLHQFKAFPGMWSFDIALLYGPSVYSSNLLGGKLYSDYRYMKIKRGNTIPVFTSYKNLSKHSVEQPRFLSENTCFKVNGTVMIDSVTWLAIEYYDNDTLRKSFIPVKITSPDADSCKFANKLIVDSLYVNQINIFYTELKKRIQLKEGSKRSEIRSLKRDKEYYKLPYSHRVSKDIGMTVFALKKDKQVVDSLYKIHLSNEGFDKIILCKNNLNRK